MHGGVGISQYNSSAFFAFVHKNYKMSLLYNHTLVEVESRYSRTKF